MRDDARARLELAQQLRQQAPVERLEEEQRHHRRFADVRFEQVAAHEAHAVLDPGAARAVQRHAQRRRVDLDAHAPRAELLCRGDDDAPVAAPQVVDHVLGSGFRQPEHFQDRCVGAREIWHLRVENRRDPVGELGVAELIKRGAAGEEREGDEDWRDCGFQTQGAG